MAGGAFDDFVEGHLRGQVEAVSNGLKETLRKGYGGEFFECAGAEVVPVDVAANFGYMVDSIELHIMIARLWQVG